MNDNMFSDSKDNQGGFLTDIEVEEQPITGIFISNDMPPISTLMKICGTIYTVKKMEHFTKIKFQQNLQIEIICYDDLCINYQQNDMVEVFGRTNEDSKTIIVEKIHRITKKHLEMHQIQVKMFQAYKQLTTKKKKKLAKQF